MFIQALRCFNCQSPNIVYEKMNRTFTPRTLVARGKPFFTLLASSAHEYSPYPTFQTFLPTYKHRIITLCQPLNHDNKKFGTRNK